MHSTSKNRWSRFLLWLFWFLTLLALVGSGHLALDQPWNLREPIVSDQTPLLAGVATHDHRHSPLFPWWLQGRWRKRVLRRGRSIQTAYRRTRWAAWRARRALGAAFTMATWVDLLTRRPLRRHLGALPGLSAFLEVLPVLPGHVRA